MADATPEPTRETAAKEIAVDYFADLIKRSFQRGGFDALCTVLRVAGAHDSDWDPFEESLRTMDVYNKLLAYAEEQFGREAARRMALPMYVHSVEMSAAHELLYNLSRVAGGQRYKAFPFNHLRRKKKKTSFATIPPSASAKFGLIREAAAEFGEQRLISLIEGMYDDRIRNAVAHSDYILSDEFFRWTESGFASQIEISEVDRRITNCFDFYTGLLSARRHVLNSLALGKRFHKWPNFEVLELLSNPEAGVYGFKVHFSNGSSSRYSRRHGTADAVNMFFEPGGSVNFMVGMLDDLTSTYKVNGEAVADWEALEQLPREG